MIAKTEAIALRIHPYSQTSHVVTWLAQGWGRLPTIIKGACRPKSAFLGQYDLFYTCELLFYERETAGLHIAKECTPLTMRSQLRHDWKGACAASAATDLVGRVLPDHAPQDHIYRLLNVVLDEAARPEVSPLLLLCWFDLHCLALLGFTPPLAQCASCASPLPGGQPLRIATPSVGLLCPDCRTPSLASRRLPPDARQILQRLQASPAPAELRRLRVSATQAASMLDYLVLFMEMHLDLSLTSHRIAGQMLQ